MAITKNIGSRLSLFLVVAVAATPTCVFADGASEKVTAQMHADLAARAADLTGVHTHLHHTLNCLVGPSGAGFDPNKVYFTAGLSTFGVADSIESAGLFGALAVELELVLGVVPARPLAEDDGEQAAASELR